VAAGRSARSVLFREVVFLDLVVIQIVVVVVVVVEILVIFLELFVVEVVFVGVVVPINVVPETLLLLLVPRRRIWRSLSGCMSWNSISLSALLGLRPRRPGPWVSNAEGASAGRPLPSSSARVHSTGRTPGAGPTPPQWEDRRDAHDLP